VAFLAQKITGERAPAVDTSRRKGKDGRRCRRVKRLAREHLGQVEKTIAQLQQLRSELKALLQRKARHADENEVCPLNNAA
jgi:hypothetical protein